MTADPRANARPLAGRTVLVTRPAGKVEALARRLEALGAEVARLPAIAFADPEDGAPLRRAAARVGVYDWVAFTSPRGVRALQRSLEEVGRDGRPARVAAVGPSTAEACRAAGWDPDLMPDRYDAEALLDVLVERAGPLEGRRVLLPLAEAARDALPRGLEERGAHVERVVAYRSMFPEDSDVRPIQEMLRERRMNLLTFTSPSTAENTLEALGPAALDVPAAVIGPATAAGAAALGFRVVAIAEPHTVDGLVVAVVLALAAAE